MSDAGRDPDRELIATLRFQALAQAGLVPLVGPLGDPNDSVLVSRPTESPSRILDTELIAIYW